MDRRPGDFRFAAVGAVHGHMHRMVRCVQEKAARVRRVPAFVPQVVGSVAWGADSVALFQVSGGNIREHTG